MICDENDDMDVDIELPAAIQSSVQKLQGLISDMEQRISCNHFAVCGCKVLEDPCLEVELAVKGTEAAAPKLPQKSGLGEQSLHIHFKSHAYLMNEHINRAWDRTRRAVNLSKDHYSSVTQVSVEIIVLSKIIHSTN